MYGGFGNSLLVGCLMKFPAMIPVIALTGGIFYSAVCDSPAPAPSAPQPVPIVQVVEKSDPVVGAHLQPVVEVAPPAPVVEEPKPALPPLPKKKIPG